MSVKEPTPAGIVAKYSKAHKYKYRLHSRYPPTDSIAILCHSNYAERESRYLSCDLRHITQESM